jgi:CBS domain containing-hemolysin-like protein
MKQVTAGDIMIPLEAYPHIPCGGTLRQAIAEIHTTQIVSADGRRSLPRRVLVFDEANQLVGIARRRDIFRGLEPRFARGAPSEYSKKLFDVETDPNLLEILLEEGIASMRQRAEEPISSVMQPITVTVQAGDHLMKIMHEMVVHDHSLLPVMRDGEVVGVVRTVDVFNQIASLLL